MMITVIMAGPRRRAPRPSSTACSRRGPGLQEHQQPGADVPGRAPAAARRTIANAESQTDGDLDIALSLLMADKQWGSGGAVNYLQWRRAT